VAVCRKPVAPRGLRVYAESTSKGVKTMCTSDELNKLDDLRRRGVLTEDEFQRAKQRVLDGLTAAPPPTPIRALHGLHRSLTDRWLGGVCGGLAVQTDLPSWLWRLIFVLLALGGGSGVLLYLLLWILLPLRPEPACPGMAAG
jgi:phage shock protein PspC (stress-responsive transcriptional regulator)